MSNKKSTSIKKKISHDFKLESLSTIPFNVFYSTKIVDAFQNLQNMFNILDRNAPDYNVKMTFSVFLLTFIVYVLYSIKNSLIPGFLIAVIIALCYYLNIEKINEFLKSKNINIDLNFDKVSEILDNMSESVISNLKNLKN